jgi:hypothetical protein
VLARLACMATLAGCFTARTPAERPRAFAYNAIAIVAAIGGIAGLALTGLGYEPMH